MTKPINERSKTCVCAHGGQDHDAGECWAQVDTPTGPLQCGFNWWEPISEASADRRRLGLVRAALDGQAPA